jgi:hypothetical protein
MVASGWLLARADRSEQRIYQADLRLDKKAALLDRVARQRAGLQRSFTSAMHELKQLQKERAARQPHQPPVQATSTAKTATPPAPPPGYVMSEGAEARPVSASPTVSDTR